MSATALGAAWLVANVVAALAFGALLCPGPFNAFLSPGIIFGVPQALALGWISRELRWWWLPLTALVTPPAMYVSFISSAMWLQANQHSDLERAIGGDTSTVGFVLLAIGATPGWLLVAVTQALLLRVAGMRPAWLWIPAVLLGGIGLDLLGAAAVTSEVLPQIQPPTGTPRCLPFVSAGGPLAWIAGGAAYAAFTGAVLYRMQVRRTSAAVSADRSR
jgi:hypothetical protein